MSALPTSTAAAQPQGQAALATQTAQATTPLAGSKRHRESVAHTEPRTAPHNPANPDEDMYGPDDDDVAPAGTPTTVPTGPARVAPGNAAPHAPPADVPAGAPIGDQRAPPDGPDAPPPPRFFRTPRGDPDYAIKGATRADILAIASSTTEHLWGLVPGPKFFAYLANDRFCADPTWATNLIQAFFSHILNDDTIVRVSAAAPVDPTRTAHHKYIPYLVHGITQRQYDDIIIVDSPLICCPGIGAIITRPYNMTPDDLAMLLGRTTIPTTPEGCEMVRDVIKEKIPSKGRISNKLDERYDNIPPAFHSLPSTRRSYIAGTVRVDGYTLTERDGANGHINRSRFNVYITPPSLVPQKHREWISLLNRAARRHNPEEAAPPRVPAPHTLQTTTEATETAVAEDETQWASEADTVTALARAPDPAGVTGAAVVEDVAALPNTTYEDAEGTRLTSTRSAGLRGPLAGTATGSMTAPASHAFGPQGVDGGQPVQGPGVPPTAPDVRQGVHIIANYGVTHRATGGPRSQECDAPTTPTTRGPAQSRGTNSQRIECNNESLNNVPRNRRQYKSTKTIRGTMNVATLNMKGASGRNTERKWRDLNHRMKVDSIAVIALQETHLLSAEKLETLNDKLGYRMAISHSGDPTAPNAVGVAFALNKNLTRYSEAIIKDIEPGRAILLTLPWQDNAKLNILNVYAPNNKVENKAFWTNLNKKWMDENLPMPDIMLGDFNLVEEAIDRVPTKPSDPNALQALNNFKATIQVADTWRLDHQNEEIFTWERTPDRQRKSRLDRIYMNTHLSEHCCDWQAIWSEVPTDHKLVSVKIFNPGAPYIGKGRWTIPLHLLQDKEVKTLINEMGNTLVNELDKYQQIENKVPQHTQTLYREWKGTLTQKIREIAKWKIPYVDKHLSEIQKLLHTTQHNPALTDEEKVEQTAALEDETVALTQKRYQKICDHMDTNGWINRETIQKPWIMENKEKKPRDVLTMLKIPNITPPKYEKRTEKMLEIARKHHNSLQDDNLPESVQIHQHDMHPVITEPETTLTNEQQLHMEQEISEEEIHTAIKSLPNGKAPGLDGKSKSSQSQWAAEC
ncbi:hypothetical protein HYPSUDRAFT_59266 [Hypholoma sublateritium FD-334 SS-4]|uniref:Endonuclease/exonuclease/phosphatase domain-containing protein n=1 Tax=Hypholoma sublateritium (strain FD-334 SS-4) TaxID=945553 RepID=A0A0D2KJ12_HYPSF|nr:hypothetical protein HYPSUDRAFT_59266 [Hypholoma sublateritium FD-334 SS-4]